MTSTMIEQGRSVPSEGRRSEGFFRKWVKSPIRRSATGLGIVTVLHDTPSQTVNAVAQVGGTALFLEGLLEAGARHMVGKLRRRRLPPPPSQG